jgi:hypothetical protein
MVKGQVSHFFKPLRKSIDSVFFDAPKIDIKAVFVNGKKANFKTNTDGVTVLFEKPLAFGKQTIALEFNMKQNPKKEFILLVGTTKII